MKRGSALQPSEKPQGGGSGPAEPILLGWGPPRTALVLPPRNWVWKSYQRSSSLFLSTQRTSYSAWLRVGALDIREKMAGGEDGGTLREEFMDTPRT